MSVRFTRALVRTPPASVAKGLRAVDRGAPSYDGVMAEHEAYVAALKRAGLTVETLPPFDLLPDSLFLEDPALVFREGAILLRPGAPSRAREAEALRPELAARFETLVVLPEPGPGPGPESGSGTVDGGDVLVLGDRVLIGLSARTNEAGARALIAALPAFGKQGEIVRTPPEVLHLKTDCAPLGEEAVLSTARLAAAGLFDGLEVQRVPEGEEAAANALRLNDHILVAEGYPKTAALLEKTGCAVRALPTTEIAKIDAGLSCLSLRWAD